MNVQDKNPVKPDADILKESLLMAHAFSPRIGKALDLFWGHKDFQPYLNKLLADDMPNGKQRQGFPVHVMSALIALQQLHDKMFPQFIIEDPDEWMSSQFGIM